jgi:hypothetical protein
MFSWRNIVDKISYRINTNDEHDTWVHIQEIESPVNSVYLSISTEFRRAKVPDAHIKKFGMVMTKYELRKLRNALDDFL